MKKIVIDARLYGPKHTGIGRYTKNLLLAISKLPNFNKYEFILIIYKNLEIEIKKDLGNKFKYVTTNIVHYSLQEQLLLPSLIYELKPDLVHFTHFNKPILYFGKSVVTVHDLIKHFFKGKDTTTKNPSIYWLKHLGYLFLTNIVIKTSNIIVPSDFWRQYLIKNFKVKSQNITTTHEAVDPKFLELKPKIVEKPENYLVYTGNLYPHKNIKIVLSAIKKLPTIKLKIICSRNYFSQKLETQITRLKLNNQVEFLGYVDDAGFQEIYSKALALVHPSLMEGFSLTGLESMALNCPVISSNASCLPEIYQDSVLYFNPHSSKELIQQIKKLQKTPALRKELIALGHKQLLKYSWEKTAKKTMDVYQDLL